MYVYTHSYRRLYIHTHVLKTEKLYAPSIIRCGGIKKLSYLELGKVLPGFFPGDFGFGMFVMSLSTGGTLGNVGSCKGVPILVVVTSREVVPEGVSGCGCGSRAMLIFPK